MHCYLYYTSFSVTELSFSSTENSFLLPCSCGALVGRLQNRLTGSGAQGSSPLESAAHSGNKTWLATNACLETDNI